MSLPLTLLPQAALERLLETKHQRHETASVGRGLCVQLRRERDAVDPGPVPYLLFLACGFGTSCEVVEVEGGEGRSPAVDRGASLYWGLLSRLSRASGSLGQHEALVLCCPQLQGACVGPGQPGL